MEPWASRNLEFLALLGHQWRRVEEVLGYFLVIVQEGAEGILLYRYVGKEMLRRRDSAK